MSLARFFFVALIGFCVIGCTKEADQRTKVYSEELKLWRKQGWFLKEVLGDEGEFISHTHLKSETARAMSAFWIDSGVGKNKRYEQDTHLFLILSFQKSDGDSFAVIMEKPK